jgi:BolA protein
MNTGDRVQRIESLLRENLAATDVQVVDESHKHRGHAGAAGGGGHFRVSVVSPRFAGLSLVQAQRLVYQALGDMMTNEIHALTITTRTE